MDGSTNIHVVAVFNPPAGYLAIYTNGVLMGENTKITISMAGVWAEMIVCSIATPVARHSSTEVASLHDMMETPNCEEGIVARWKAIHL